MLDGHDDELLTYGEAAALLGISDRHVSRLVRAGRLRATRIDHSVRIRRGEIDRFVTEREQGTDRMTGDERGTA